MSSADAKLPKMFWVQAMSTAVRVRNLCPTTSNEKHLSPKEMHYGQPSKVSSLRVFVCLAFYLDRGNRRKLDPKGKKSKFVGFDVESKAYLLMDLDTRRVVRARSVTFNENIIPDDFMVDSEPLQTLELSIEGCIDVEQPSTTKTSESRNSPIEGDTSDSVGATEENQVEEEVVDSHSTDHPVQRSVRTRNAPINWPYTHASVTGNQEPGGYSEAVSGA